MKLAMFRHESRALRPALISEDGVHDICQHIPAAPSDMVALIEQIDAFTSALARLGKGIADYKLSDVTLAAPVTRPGKIMALGLNYRDHAAEASMDLPEIQTWFSKMTSSINGPYDSIDLPKVSDKLDYEAEMAFVIGKKIRHATREQAKAAIFGYCCANDVSVRDFQFHSTQFVVGKSFDTHCPLGPWLTTADEVADPQKLGIRCTVNGEERQNSNTSEMVFDVYAMVEYLSQAMTLEPGDVILTGTPAGVGAVRQPRLFLKEGEVVRVEIEGLGSIENKVAAER